MWLARLDDSATEDFKFPNWRKVVPNEEAVYKTTFEGIALVKGKCGSRGLTEFLRGLPETTIIDINFLYSLGVGVTWELSWIGNTKPLRFIAGNRMAVIMPMNPN